MNQLAPTLKPAFALVVLNGPEAGVTYQLSGGNITIGRSSENAIPFPKDAKISRVHARLVLHHDGVEIQDVSEKNKVLVGGREVTSQFLKAGDIIQLGDTKFQFKAYTDADDQKLLARMGARVAASARDSLSRKSRSSRTTSAQGPGRLNFYILVAAVAILAAWLLSTENKVTKEVNLRNEEARTNEITTNDKIIEQVMKERALNKSNTDQYKEAQLHFVKGFRDYRKGQYERGKESFEACLSLMPSHPQCTRYLNLSDKKFSEHIQYQMILGNKYKAQGQYTACKSAYQNAWVMIKNPTDKMYAEAKSGYRACEALEGDRF